MNKKIISFCAIAFGFLGGYIPALFGDSDFFDGWMILGGLIGGLFGVWVGVVISRRWGD